MDKEMKVYWRNGNLAVDYDDRTMITIFFYDSFHDHKLSRLEKVHIIQEIARIAHDDLDIREHGNVDERNDEEPVQQRLPFDEGDI